MNKVTTAALAGLLAVTAGAQASASRWGGFGSASAYIADVQDIFTLPGVVASHADTTYFELGAAAANPALPGNAYNGIAPTNVWGGVHSKLGGGVLGLWFNRVSGTINGIDPGFSVPDAGGAVPAGTAAAFLASVQATLNNQIDVLYGFNLSDATTLGIGVSRATNSTKAETTTTGSPTTSTETNVGDFGISLGVEQKEVGPISLLEIGLQYSSRGDSFVNKAAATDKISANGSAINLRVGGDMTGDKGMFSRIELGFATQSLELKDELATAPAANTFVNSKNSASTWNLGYAMGGSNDKGMGLMGLMLSGNGQSRDEAFNGSEVNKTDMSKMGLLATTAGEAKINGWLSLRAGLESNLFYTASTTTEAGAAGATTKVVTTNDAPAANGKASMGTTITLGDITIDGVLNQDLLYTGTYLVSGVPGALSSQVSLTWPWGGSKQ
jgi:hypothetical protein